MPISTIKIVSLRPVGENALELRFSDGSFGTWSASALIERNTELTAPLAGASYFRRAFLEAGALAWPNGLELSAHSLQTKLAEAGALNQQAA